jgi:hypothetical protein
VRNLIPTLPTFQIHRIYISSSSYHYYNYYSNSQIIIYESCEERSKLSESIEISTISPTSKIMGDSSSQQKVSECEVKALSRPGIVSEQIFWSDEDCLAQEINKIVEVEDCLVSFVSDYQSLAILHCSALLCQERVSVDATVCSGIG